MSQPQARVGITVAAAAALFSVIGGVFWFEDLRYSRPTPIPVRYDPPVAGAVLPLPAALAVDSRDTRPVLLHFFNQDCPCSRFNVDQARSLATAFRDRVRFVLVLQMEETEPGARARALAAAEKKFGSVEGIADADGKIAERYGVYSTPQAVILDARGAIAYRGNYNASRYCTDPVTEYARIALEAVLAGRPAPVLPELAHQAYGCELPQASIQ